MQPHWELIRSMREEGATWPEITEKLEGLGVTTQPHGVQQYYKRKTQPKRGGLGLPGWGNPAPVAEPAPAKPQAGKGSEAPGQGAGEPADMDFTPTKENDPFDKLEKALKGKRGATTDKDSPEKS